MEERSFSFSVSYHIHSLLWVTKIPSYSPIPPYRPSPTTLSAHRSTGGTILAISCSSLLVPPLVAVRPAAVLAQLGVTVNSMIDELLRSRIYLNIMQVLKPAN
jgi:hypothetical protein